MQTEFIFLMIFVFLSHVVQTVTGFGSAIIAITLGAIFYDMDYLIPVLVPVNYLLVLYIVVRHNRNIKWKILFRDLLPYFILGMPLGFVIFFMGPGDWLKLIYGVFVILIAALEIYKLSGKSSVSSENISKPKSIAILMLAGFIHGVYATGGPVAVYYASRRIPGKSEFRSTINFLWLISGTVMIITYIAGGKLTSATAMDSTYLLISLVSGIILGEWLYKKIEETLFRKIVMIMLMIIGIITLVKNMISLIYS